MQACGRLMASCSAGVTAAEERAAEAEQARATVASLQAQQLSLSDWAKVQRALQTEIVDLLGQRSEISAQRDSLSRQYEELSASHVALVAQV